MTVLAERLRARFFRDEDHPYQRLTATIDALLQPGMTLLDAGCGRTPSLLTRYRGRAGRLIGVDLVTFDGTIEGIELLNEDLAHLSVASGSVDLIVSRSVMEHLAEPQHVYAEMARILKPGGRFVFITANLWDYASLISLLLPNRWHPWLVSRLEGREEEDVFPIHYRTNTRRAVERLAKEAGFEIETFRYLGQYPSYFMFNGGLFLLATAYEKIISRFEFLAGLRGWLFVVLRKPETP